MAAGYFKSHRAAISTRQANFYFFNEQAYIWQDFMVLLTSLIFILFWHFHVLRVFIQIFANLCVYQLVSCLSNTIEMNLLIRYFMKSISTLLVVLIFLEQHKNYFYVCCHI